MSECPGCCSDENSPYYGKCLYDEVYVKKCDTGDSSNVVGVVFEVNPEADATVEGAPCPCAPSYILRSPTAKKLVCMLLSCERCIASCLPI